MGVTAAVANALLNYVLKGTYPTYVSLHTAAPTISVSAEVTGIGYVREFVNPADWTTPANAVSSTSVAVTFPVAGNPWGTITHVALYDAVTDGNLLWSGAMITPRVVGTGETISFSIGAISGQVI